MGIVWRGLKAHAIFPVSGLRATMLQVYKFSPGRVEAVSTGVGFPVPQ